MKHARHWLATVVLLLCSVMANADNIASGICGSNLTWKLSDTGELIIDGSGAMGNYTHSYGDYAPWNEYRNSIKTVTILEGVTSVGERAFWNCIYLTAITIPESVTNIVYGAFMECSRLTAITIPENSQLTSIGQYAFEDCSSLSSITIPESVTSIGAGAFSGCSSLTSITIPEGVTSIGEYTFSGCSGLTSFIIPNSVTSIGMYAFRDCNLSVVFIGENVTSINGSAFQYGCSSIHTVINYSALSISKGTSAAGYVAYHALKVLNVRDLVNIDGFLFRSEDDKHYLVGYIGEEVDMVLPDSYMGDAYMIDEYAFYKFTSFTTLTIPNNVTSIGWSAFEGCTSLATLTIGSSVASIVAFAFADCNELLNIYALNPNPITCNESIFSTDAYNNATLYVPEGCDRAYSRAMPWTKFYIQTITAPTNGFDVTIGSAGYATLYLDYAVERPRGVEVYYVSQVTGNYAILKAVWDYIPANTGVILRGSSGTYTFAETAVSVPAISGNMLRGTTVDTEIEVQSDTEYYALGRADGVVGLYKAKIENGYFFNNANKAYLPLTVEGGDEGEQLSQGFSFRFPEGGTEIEYTESNVENRPVIYDLQGRPVLKISEHGIYIINGKKVVR